MEIVLYGREDCCLCHDAAALLRGHQARYGYELREVSIGGDQRLEALYGRCIPVVVIDGRERFRGRIEEGLLLRELARGRRARRDAP